MAFTQAKANQLRSTRRFRLSMMRATTVQTVLVGSSSAHEACQTTSTWRGSTRLHDELADRALNGIRRIMFFKHEAYKNENEYRFQQLFRYGRARREV
jgi:hypothetical protein